MLLFAKGMAGCMGGRSVFRTLLPYRLWGHAGRACHILPGATRQSSDEQAAKEMRHGENRGCGGDRTVGRHVVDVLRENGHEPVAISR